MNQDLKIIKTVFMPGQKKGKKFMVSQRENEVKEHARKRGISCWHAAEEMVEGYVVTGTAVMLYDEALSFRHEGFEESAEGHLQVFP